MVNKQPFTVKRLAGAAACIAFILALGAPPPALGASPWWHLTSGARPASLSTAPGIDEQYTVAMGATTDEFYLTNGYGTEAVFPSTATHAEVQKGLEVVYGTGNVEVTGGPGNVQPYTVTFVGGLADQDSRENQRIQLVGQGRVGGEITIAKVRKGQNDGEIVLTASNLGDAGANGESSSIVIADKLPAGLRAVGIDAGAGTFHAPVQCTLVPLQCVYNGSLGPYKQIEVAISVVVEGAGTGELNEVSVTGGEAPAQTVRRPISIGPEPGFGIENYELTPEEEGGQIGTQAGSHPFQLTTTIGLDQNEEAEPEALVKDLRFKLPPGLIGNATVIPRCNLGAFLQFSQGDCPKQTAVGVAIVTVNEPNALGVTTFTVPVFNLEPSYGEPARFGFMVAGNPVYLDTSLRTGEDYGVTVDVNNITQTAAFLGSLVTLWGVPGDPRHDSARGVGCIGEASAEPCTPLGVTSPPPFLDMPTSCTGPLQTSVESDAWARPGAFVAAGPSEAMAAQDGCNRLPFTPSINVTPDGQAGSTPTGLTVDEHVGQESSLDPAGLAESTVKGLSVTLPQGVALNPAAADGLQACSMEQIGMQSPAATACPEAAKVANVTIKTPLLGEPLEGAAYLATQDSNPFGSLVALYVYAENAREGIRAKAAGEVLEDPVTGQLTAHFEGDPLFQGDPSFSGDVQSQYLPPVTFEDVELHFYGGDRAPLATPAHCGAYTTTGTFTPWSGNATASSSSTFDIVSGPNESPCANPLPFAPSLTAGTTSIQAGGFTPFEMTMSREDGEQSLQGIELHMPPGLSGTLSTVKLCGEEQADAGTCGEESQIGETIVSVGVGGDPYTVKGGKVYITGPYKGAPFGLSIVNPAKAGPFDLGKVVVRAKLEVDQETAAITVKTDNEGPYRIPTIIDGIPLQIKHVNVAINRPGFTFNATNCSPLSVGGTLASAEGSARTVSVPYQVTNCAVLAFKPKLQATTSGRPSRANGTSLHVKLSYPAGPYDANISRVKVELPKQLPSRLPTLQKACLASVFDRNPAACPAASVIGHATATTPVLPVPLTGPAYFVSHGGEAFPSLVIVLQGYGVTVHLVGSTFISKQGITSSTFKTVPDVPVGTFELTLPQGPYSALTALTNPCKTKLTMPTEFLGQNGALIKTTTRIAAAGCPKGRKAAHKRRKAAHKLRHGTARKGTSKADKGRRRRGG